MAPCGLRALPAVASSVCSCSMTVSEAPQASAEQSSGCLPPGLLTRVISHLEGADLRRAAQVSRLWHAHAHAPELCRTVQVECCAASGPRPLRSLLLWLLRHARHVRDLRLHMHKVDRGGETAQLLASCVSVCAAAGRLEALAISTWTSRGGPLLVSSWVPALANLQQLALGTLGADLQLVCSLHPLTALRKLRLAAGSPECQVQLRRGVRLPAGLEELELCDWEAKQLHKQLAGLSALHTLLLHAPDWSLKNDAALLRLPRLRRLHLKYCPRVPACLGRLSQLEELHLYRLADAAGVDAALRPLTGLTSLAVLDTAGTPQLPALTGLSRLQRACFTGSRCCQPDEIQPEAASLPHGAWAASLRQLGAPYGVLLRSGQLLAAAGQLERLGVLGGDLAAAPDNASERFWRWCATHSPLRQLQVEAERDQAVSPSVLAAAAGLRDERPALRVQCRVDVGEFDEEFFYYLEDD